MVYRFTGRFADEHGELAVYADHELRREQRQPGSAHVQPMIRIKRDIDDDMPYYFFGSDMDEDPAVR